MAAVVRVKRRRNEDAVEALLISCKRRKNNATDDTASEESDKAQVESLLKFAGTIPAKDVTISKHIRDAIRKEKLEKEYKQHSYGGDITVRNREQRQVISQSNRYKILTSYRTLGLDDLDAATVEGCEPNADVKEVVKHEGCVKEVVMCDSDIKNEVKLDSDRNNTTEFISPILTNSEELNHHGNCKKHPQSTDLSTDDCSTNANNENIHKPRDEHNENTAPYTSTCECFTVKQTLPRSVGSDAQSSHSVDQNSAESSEKFFCLYDVEEEKIVNNNNVQPGSSQSEFTCNSVPMTREVVPADPEEYVYDLYYTNSSNLDFRMFENILKIEALQENVFVDDRLNVSDGDEVVDDDDDSNDEDNWRNDYPNEDPHFYENADAEYYYGDDGLGNHLFDHDEPLSEWMSSRCNIEDDGEYLNEESPSPYNPLLGPSATYEQYLKRVDNEIDLLDD